MHLHTQSVEETLALGRKIGHAARTLLQSGAITNALCIALDGQLGAGKTQLARGIAEGAHVADPTLVSSPTYVLMNIYEPGPGGVRVYHIDAYRVPDSEQMSELGIDEITGEVAVLIVEWAQRIGNQIPSDNLHIQIEHESPDAFDVEPELQPRSFALSAHGPASHQILVNVTTSPSS